MKYSIIIPVFNNLNLIRNCINSIYQVYCTEATADFEIIVVDKASTDWTYGYLLECGDKYDNFKYIENQSNHGFAGACNQGAVLKIFQSAVLKFLNREMMPCF